MKLEILDELMVWAMIIHNIKKERERKQNKQKNMPFAFLQNIPLPMAHSCPKAEPEYDQVSRSNYQF